MYSFQKASYNSVSACHRIVLKCLSTMTYIGSALLLVESRRNYIANFSAGDDGASFDGIK